MPLLFSAPEPGHVRSVICIETVRECTDSVTPEIIIDTLQAFSNFGAISISTYCVQIQNGRTDAGDLGLQTASSRITSPLQPGRDH